MITSEMVAVSNEHSNRVPDEDIKAGYKKGAKNWKNVVQSSKALSAAT